MDQQTIDAPDYVAGEGRPPKRHKLKCWPEFFQPVYDGRKNFEVRLNDRDFRVLDTLELWEWSPDICRAELARMLAEGWTRAPAEGVAEGQAYSGRSCERLVGYILYSAADPVLLDMEGAHAGLAQGHVAMSLCSTPADAAAKQAAYEAHRREWRELNGLPTGQMSER